MAGWATVEAEAAPIAERARALLEQFRFVYIGTLRRDGTPRISAVEARVVHGELVMSMIPATLKARDLLRDPRVCLNFPLVHHDDPNEEIKLRGRGRVVRDEGLVTAAAAAIEATSGWRPPPDWLFFAVDVTEAALISWTGGVMRMTRWTADGGLKETTRRMAVIA